MSDDDIQGLSNDQREVPVITPPSDDPEPEPSTTDTSSSDDDDGGGDAGADATLVFEEGSFEDDDPGGELKGTVRDPEKQQKVQDFAESRAKTQDNIERERELSEQGKADISTLDGPKKVRRNANISLAPKNSRFRQGRTIQNQLRAADKSQSKFARDLRTLKRARKDAQNPFLKNTLQALETTSRGISEAGELVQAPFVDPKGSFETAKRVASNPVKTAKSIDESFERLGDKFESPRGGGVFVGTVATDAITDVPVGTLAVQGAKKAGGAIKRGITRLRPDFKRVKSLDSGAEVIDVDGANLRDDVNRIELVEPAGARDVDAQQAAEEGLGVEAQQGAFARDFEDQLTIAREQGGEQTTFGTAQTGLFEGDNFLDNFRTVTEQELRSPDTIEEAKELARETANSDDPRESLFFASPPTEQGNIALRKSRLLPEQRESGIFSVPKGSQKKQAQAILVEGELKDIFDEKPRLESLARRAESGDAQAKQEFANELLDLQFSKDKEFTPFGFVRSPESEVTTNAPVLFKDEQIGKTIIDGETTDIVKANLGKPDDLDKKTKQALDDADTLDDAKKALDASDEVVGSSRTAPETRFSGSKATSQLTAPVALKTAQSATSTVSEQESPGASQVVEELENAVDVRPVSEGESSTKSTSQPKSPFRPASSGVPDSATGTPSSAIPKISGTPSVPSSSPPSSSKTPPSGTSNPPGGSGGSSGGSSRGGSSGGSSGGGGSGGSGGPPGRRRRQRNDDSQRKSKGFDVTIGREGNEIFRNFEDLTRREAQKAVQLVKQSSAASFKITDQSGNAVSPDDIGLNIRGIKESRTRQGGFVEIPSQRIQSQGELEDITFNPDNVEPRPQTTKKGSPRPQRKQSPPRGNPFTEEQASQPNQAPDFKEIADNIQKNIEKINPFS